MGLKRGAAALCTMLVALQLVLAGCSIGSPAATPVVATPTPEVAQSTAMPPPPTRAATPGVATPIASPRATPPSGSPVAAGGSPAPRGAGLCAFAPPIQRAGTPAVGTPARTPTAAPPRTPPPPTRTPAQGTPAVAGRPDQSPPTIPLPELGARYALDINEIRFDAGHLRTRETVEVVNREDCGLDRLYFSVTAARWGWFTLDAARLDGQPADARLDRTVLTMRLARPLGPGARATVALDFRLDVGQANDPYTPADFAGTTRSGDIWRLAYWFPVLSDDHQYPPFLDPPYTATADYEVTIAAPADLVIAHTGTVAEERPGGDGTVTRRISAPNVRDFTLAISPNYRVVSRTAANGVLVEVYYSPQSLAPLGQNPAAAQAQVDRALDAGVTAIERYSELIGPYPYPVFRIVDGGPRLGGGIEFPMLTMVNLLVRGIAGLVYHEAAHEWFYGVLGTRTQQDPWIDEGGASFLAGYLEGSLPPDPPGPRTFAYRLGISVWEVPPGGTQAAATRAIYDQGEAFFERVRQAMGEQAFWAALQDLYRAERFGIVTPRELLSAWQRHSPVDLRPLFTEYLDYDWIDGL